MQICVLGSGSGGNSTVVRCGEQAMLIDAGFGPVSTARRLTRAGLDLGRVKAIVLTHLDQDHFRPQWMRTLIGWSIPIYVHHWHAADLGAYDGIDELAKAGLVRTFDVHPFQPLADSALTVAPFPLAHDLKGTFAFHVQAPDGGQLGYATDLGHVPEPLLRHFAGVDVLAIESNYDPPMQLRSSRPLFLKRRIMGHAGHLSNEQAFEMVRAIARRSGRGNPQHIVLLHRSRQCNHPDRIHEVFAQEPDLRRRLCLTEQRRRSRWVPVEPLALTQRQQMLFEF